MTPTDLSELSLELLIMSDPGEVGPDEIMAPSRGVGEQPVVYGKGWQVGHPDDFDREFLVDRRQLTAFLLETQPETAEKLGLQSQDANLDGLLARVEAQVARHGVVDVLRRGVDHQSAHVDLYYPRPTAGNETAARLFSANRFTVTRQVRYSSQETQRALDLVLFVNGLPLATFELKNTITGQTVADAIEQYKTTRLPRERMFQFGVCAVHFALDDQEAWFTTELKGTETSFLPFNRGHDHSAGNPVNPNGPRTAFLWQETLQRDSLAALIESFIQLVKPEKKKGSGDRKPVLIFPRYHQLDVVQKLVAHADAHGSGHKYLVQHSAGSGKSNSIAWLAYQLANLEHSLEPVFDSVIVVTDRRVLDDQIGRTIKAMGSQTWMVGKAERSGQLRGFLQQGKRIIVTTIQKFPFILEDIGKEHRDRSFAIIIDEAHSSQGGRATSAVNQALGNDVEEGDEGYLTPEDQIHQMISSRPMLTNASYFAFTATPKNKTLELFGSKRTTADGRVEFVPFHTYSMKQAIQEGFILDVLQNFTPVKSYYQLVKAVENDPEVDVQKAGRELRRFVESHEVTIDRKAAIIVDHVLHQVIGARRINGEARALVATRDIDRAISYWLAINRQLKEAGSVYRALIAFTGEREVAGKMSTEAMLNGFPSKQIPAMFREHPNRLLVVADKFLTGYDEPLLHTMYVDKPLAGVKAVQALSRLNRAAPGKHDTFILDFFNDADMIVKAFEPYYQTTLLSGETDPNKLHDLYDALMDADVISVSDVEGFVRSYLANVTRDKLDPLLDTPVERYLQLDEDGQIEFKGNAKAFNRTYNFLASLLTWGKPEWERLSIYLTFLIPRLPMPGDDLNLGQDIFEAIDLDSYRAEKQASRPLTLADEDVHLDPVPTSTGGLNTDPIMDRLSAIIATFNELLGDTDFSDADRVKRHATVTILDELLANEDLQSAHRHSDEQNRRIEFNQSLFNALLEHLQDETELYQKFQTDKLFQSQFGTQMYELWRTRMSHGDAANP